MTEHDKLVEDATEAAMAEVAKPRMRLNHTASDRRVETGIIVRAALAIAVERCAAEVLAQKNSGFVWRDVEYGWDVACDSAAAAIRALLVPNT